VCLVFLDQSTKHLITSSYKLVKWLKRSYYIIYNHIFNLCISCLVRVFKQNNTIVLIEALWYTMSISKTRPFKLSKCLKGGVLSVLNKYLGFYLFK